MILHVSLLISFLYSAWACDTGEYSVTNQTIIVTGAGRGIGYAIADNFLAQGAKFVIIVDKNVTTGPAACRKLNSKYGCNKAVFYRCNVYKDLKCFDKIVAKYKNVGTLVNSAGILNEYKLYEMVQTNVFAYMYLSFKFQNQFRKDRNGPGGTIINISSRAGYTEYPVMPAYTGTNFAILGFSIDLGHYYNCRKTGIRVITMCPDYVETEMTRELIVAKDQEVIARKLVKASKIQSADAVGKATVEVFKTAATGTSFTVSGGVTFKAPKYEYISTELLDSF